MNSKRSKILGIIPARGGSKGISRKNIRLLRGKPLIAYSIKAAFKSKYIDRIVVSTEDEEIAEISKKHGSEVIKRPKELARDESPTIDTIFHALKVLKAENYNPDIIILLQLTSPLRTVEDIDNAIKLFLDSDCESVVSVCEFEHSPYWCFKIEEGYLKSLFGDGYLRRRRQDLEKVYMPNGAMYISTPENLRKYKSFYCLRTIPYIMPPERSIDIDNEVDLMLAELLTRGMYEIGGKIRMEKIRIGNRTVGEEEPCFIIAEAGVNHNGSVEMAKKLIDDAKDAGADAVKFQTFIAENVVTKTAEKAEYQKKSTDSRESQYEMIKNLELSKDDFKKLADYANKKDILFLSSPFDKGSVDLLDMLDVPAFKIGSGEITNYPLLRYISKKGKPVILSTGMSTLEDVEEALNIIRREGVEDVILLHCVSNYPAKMEDVNLRAMETLKQAFQIPVGFSDHSLGITVSIAAAALGACVIEKHFTLDRKLQGPDHKASLEPDEFKKMVKAIKDVEKALGDGVKRPTKDEEEIKKIARRSVVAMVDIPEGTIITEDVLDIKRPGTGIEPKCLNLVIGRKAKEDIKKDDIVMLKMIE